MKKRVFISLFITVLVGGGILFYANYQDQTQRSDTVVVTNPRPDQTITSPIAITGQATGAWYFEAQFPVRLLDSEGKTIGTSTAIAQGEWTTEDLVPFVAELTFTKPETSTGTLVLQNDNPSGLAENEMEFIVSVKF